MRKQAKIEIRIDAAHKKLIVQAAAHTGMNVSSYVRQLAIRAARLAIAQRELS